MDNIIIMIVLILVIGSASLYIWKERKKGIKCIGCPSAINGTCKSCSGCDSDSIETCLEELIERNMREK